MGDGGVCKGDLGLGMGLEGEVGGGGGAATAFVSLQGTIRVMQSLPAIHLPRDNTAHIVTQEIVLRVFWENSLFVHIVLFPPRNNFPVSVE